MGKFSIFNPKFTWRIVIVCLQVSKFIMVRELECQRQGATFPESAPAANSVLFRTYSRLTETGLRETWEQVCDRTLRGLVEQNLSLVLGDICK